jgi:hypothetical protein
MVMPVMAVAMVRVAMTMPVTMPVTMPITMIVAVPRMVCIIAGPVVFAAHRASIRDALHKCRSAARFVRTGLGD